MNRAARRRGEVSAEPPRRGPFAPVGLVASFSAVPVLLLLVFYVLPPQVPESLVLVLSALPGAFLVNAWARTHGVRAPVAVLGYYVATLVFLEAVLKFRELLKVEAPLVVPVGYVAFCVAGLWLVHRALGSWLARVQGKA